MPHPLSHLSSRPHVLLLAAAMSLSACGGGGEGGGELGDTQSTLSNNAYLAGIELSAGSLDQALQTSQYEYTATVGFLMTSIEISASAAHLKARLSINGTELTAGSRINLPLNVGSNLVTVIITAEDGSKKTYTVDITRQHIDQFAQQAYVKASNTNADDGFGFSVAIDGNWMVVGAPFENSNGSDDQNNTMADAGAVYVFQRNGENWMQQAYLKADNAAAHDRFGYSVAIDGDTLVIGAAQQDSTNAGAAYVFQRSGDAWVQQAFLKADNADAADEFGFSVAIDGDSLVVGAIKEDSVSATSGAAYVFQRSGDNWNQQAYLKALHTGVNDWFGYSVAIDGDTLVVGAIREDSNANTIDGDQSNNDAGDAGAAYVFQRSGDTWQQHTYLKGSNAAANDWFGHSVAIDGDTLVVGSTRDDSDVIDSGAAYVFQRSGDTWHQQAQLKASNPDSSDQFGSSVAIDGDTLVVSATGEDSNTRGINGEQQNNDANASGAAYVFQRSGDTWQQQAYLKASNTDAGDEFGISVDIDGDTVAIGGWYESSFATGIDGDQGNHANGDYSGAVYVFQ